MGQFLEKLIDVASAPLLECEPEDASLPLITTFGGLQELFQIKNGFYAFESALHVFPSKSIHGELGLKEWNSSHLWVGLYQGMADGGTFFAEDVFGGQFCITSNGICYFDPETANFEILAKDIEQWAKLILEDYEFLTGYTLAHEWQQAKGLLKPGTRLLPKTPFVVGGDFAVSNLCAIDSVEAMRARANLAIQIKDLPDGAQIRWNIEDA